MSGHLGEPQACECSIGLSACEPLTLDRLGREARAYGITRLAREIGVSRESIYRGFREGGNPMARTVLLAAKVLFLHPHVEPIGSRKEQS